MTAHLRLFFNHSTSRAIGLVFAMQGLLFGTWSSMIPYIKQKFQLDEAQLGLLLLALPAGVTLMNPLSVGILHRLGTVRATLIARTLGALFFVIPFLMPQVGLVALALFVMGTTFSTTNVSMNTAATSLEKYDGIRIMSTCHALWSSGAMFGSALGATSMGMGVHPVTHVMFMGSILLLSTLFIYQSFQKVPSEVMVSKSQGPRPKFRLPNAALWGLISISLCTNLTEGTMADWSAVYMREIVKAPAALWGWGFAAYALFMALTRFAGDAILKHHSGGKVLRVGGCVAASGLLLAVLLPYPATVLIGFAMVGAGVSLGAPILYSAAAKVPGMAPGAGLATMNTFAMVGFLGGPAVIGFIAKGFSLPVALGVVIAAGGIWIWRAGYLKG
ncbi:MAG TPA: MFS transporter, partial [Haliscomenobacter sp.]|uniref:MFS transporter n=1 Tax=Haliscomenobacter sp. TaxID=2717303 RepID=UPI001D23DD59|nr:MFS transporter [Haliscomenobacter sp.]MBK9489004.1 MFS transporter [Haliscomenobacter sp.]HOY19546.1 MFS transporter [Haliscomenobacter sp.]